MKKNLVRMELGKFYESDYGKLVVRPAGVEPKYEGDDCFKSEITDDYPQIPITKAFRDEKLLNSALNGGKIVCSTMDGGKDPSFIEFGVETIENKSFSICGMTLNQEIQRWYLNIHSLNHNSLLFTSHTIEESLDALTDWLKEHNLNLVAVNDFIEKLTTNENLKFIKKITAEPKQPKKEFAHNVLQSIEDCDDLQMSLIAWLGNVHLDDIPAFTAEFCDALDGGEEMDEVYKIVDKYIHPKNIFFFREMERLLEWMNSSYDPRCLTDEAIRCINGGLDELGKQCIEKFCKSVGNDHIGGWYLHNTKENENKYISPSIKVSDDVMDFIDQCGYELFSQNFNSALNKLGYCLDQIVEVSHSSSLGVNKPEKVMTFVLEGINPKKAL